VGGVDAFIGFSAWVRPNSVGTRQAKVRLPQTADMLTQLHEFRSIGLRAR